LPRALPLRNVVSHYWPPPFRVHGVPVPRVGDAARALARSAPASEQSDTPLFLSPARRGLQPSGIRTLAYERPLCVAGQTCDQSQLAQAPPPVPPERPATMSTSEAHCRP